MDALLHRLKRVFTGMMLVLVCGLFTSCTTPDAVTKQNTFNLYSVQDDVQLGRSALSANLEELKKQGVKINEDTAELAKLKTMVHRIGAVSDMPNLPYEVTLVQTGIVNAAAMPGGQMLVFEGLYDPKKGLVKDDDEMAAVMAHEIAHVTCRHSTEQMSRVMPVAVLAEVGAAVADANDKSGLAQGLRAAFTVGSALILPIYSRKDESEADRVGLFYMAKAGYDPRAAARIWKRATQQGTAGGPLSLLSTHPSNKNRFEALDKLMPYAMNEYARATGSYPKDYTAPAGGIPPEPFDWRTYK
jgi:predicted Zn-dependent protease